MRAACPGCQTGCSGRRPRQRGPSRHEDRGEHWPADCLSHGMKLTTTIFSLALLTGIPGFTQDTPKDEMKKAGQDVKEAGKSTGRAAKHAGKGVSKGTKTG